MSHRERRAAADLEAHSAIEVQNSFVRGCDANSFRGAPRGCRTYASLYFAKEVPFDSPILMVNCPVGPMWVYCPFEERVGTLEAIINLYWQVYELPECWYTSIDGVLVDADDRLSDVCSNICPFIRIHTCFECVTKTGHLDLQSADFFSDEGFDLLRHTLLKSGLLTRSNLFSEDSLTKFLESLVQIRYWSLKCNTFEDYYNLLIVGYSMLTGGSLTVVLKNKVQSILFSEVQSGDDILPTLRRLFDWTQSVNDTPLIKKLVSLYSFMLTQGLLKKFGLELNDEEYSRVEQRAFLAAFSSKKAFYMCVIDVSLFICERIQEWHVTGDLTNFLHSSDEYTRWMQEADRILNLAPFVGNLEAHNTSYFTFLADLDHSIEKGGAYAKYTRASSGVDSVVIKRKLNSLCVLKNVEITRRAAQQEREAPFGVLVYGSSSVAKSAFTKVLFNYYGALFNLDRNDHFRYVRNPLDEYWSNFDTSKWCVQLDDIAFLNPSKVSELDPTLQDMLNVINNVPYVPPQAALEDKGKTPVMAKLVIATSNCDHLNAHEYFWCPLAVRRRLPYVVNVKPKKEYLHNNGIFIDPAKIDVVPGTFPDLWDITVSKIVPRINGKQENAVLEEVATFSNINDFLPHFGRMAREHDHNQKQSIDVDKSLSQLSVCDNCLRPTNVCNCYEVQSGYVDTLTEWRNMIFNYIFSLWISVLIASFLNRYSCTRGLLYRSVNYITDARRHIALVGALNASPRNSAYKKFSAALASAAAIYFIVRTVCRVVRQQCTQNNVSQAVEAPSVVKTQDQSSNTELQAEFKIQGNIFKTTQSDLPRESTQNVWYRDDACITSFDMPLASKSLVGASDHDIRNLFGKNCVVLRIRADGDVYVRETRGFFPCGHVCVTNGHSFKDRKLSYSVEIIRSGVMPGITPNVKMRIGASDVYFHEGTDFCSFVVHELPPFKDLRKFFADKYLPITSAVQLVRERNGDLRNRSIFGITLQNNFPIESLDIEQDVYLGTCSETTAVGECGALTLGTTPRGPVIIGIHVLGREHACGVLAMRVSLVNELVKGCYGTTDLIVGGGEPMFDTDVIQNRLGPLHRKSVFRYIERGSCNLYGSFLGFRPQPKSSVCATPLQKCMLEHFSIPISYTKPVMYGWEPWRKNVEPMVDTETSYSRSILRACVEGLTHDILSGLPPGWESQLVVLDDYSSVNGVTGVKYIDRLNVSTSMGFPWRTTKKKYTISDVRDEYPDGINFDDGVWDRVRKIESLYLDGQRAFPVFCAHLKDEPTSFESVKKLKTRVFTGAPVDWSLVVRKYLLSFVRLVQKNKFVFEAGPGTVCQSSEWGDIYEYLTLFGADRIIAGDYEKYDKKMRAYFMLAAFDVILNIHRQAGATDDELRVIRGIGTDTSYSFVDMNGDLVEFFGTNPSGHPLTVIINSIVNSLYVRYSYYMCNPEQEVYTFRQNVRLFTYGDDNILGVSTNIDWFNHTTMQLMLSTIGVGYTMAEKGVESQPFISIYDATFLKRKWRWDEEVGYWMAPLALDSIYKSLTVWVPSKTIDKFCQMVQVISSANSEFFFYGREFFDVHHSFFREVLLLEPYAHYVQDSTLPNFDTLVERFHEASMALSP